MAFIGSVSAASRIVASGGDEIPNIPDLYTGPVS
jgi:hypothetical protein